MKKLIFLSIISFFAVLFFNGCERTELNAPTFSTGTASFARYVAIGNSLTAGYQSGALYKSGQDYSFSALIAKQAGANFAIPYIADPGSGNRIQIARFDIGADGSTTPVTRINPDIGAPLNLTYPMPYNNLGVPGALLYDFNNATNSTNCFSAIFGGTPNPFFDLVLRNTGTQFQQARALSPTFVTFWMGNNDVLGYATSGGTVPITPDATFNILYGQAMDSLASLGANVVVANIPNVAVLPFLTTVGGQLMLKGTMAVFGTKADGSVGLLDLRKNYLTLNAQAELLAGKGTSPADPLSNRVVLDEGEVKTVMAAVARFNGMIAAQAAAKGFPLVDIYAEFNKIAATGTKGYYYNGQKFTVEYIRGNLFSLDGVHPSSQGAAIVANQFILKINSAFKASIPLIDVSTIPGSIVVGKNLEYSPLGIPIFEPGTFDNLLF